MSQTSKDAFRRNFTEPLEFIYGPVLVAVIFAIAVNLEQSREVIYASSENYAQIRKAHAKSVFAWPVAKEFLTSVMRVAVIATLPASVVSASRWATRVGGYGEEGQHLRLARLAGALAWGGYVIALIRVLGERKQIEGQYDLIAEFVFAVLVFTFFMAVYLIVDARMNLRSQGQQRDTTIQRNWRRSIIAIASVFVLINVFFPRASIILGPVATSAGMLSIISYVFAGLTVFSVRNQRIPFPAIFILIWLIVVVSGQWQALYPAFAALLFALGTLLGLAIPILRDFRFDMSDLESPTIMQRIRHALKQIWLKIIEIAKAFSDAVTAFFRRFLDFGTEAPMERWIVAIAVASVLVSISYKFVPDCRTYSGCNPVVGKESSQDRWPDPATLVEHNFKTGDDRSGDTHRRITMVGAQGGGLYAAYHAAYYLAHVADSGDGAADDIFAVSSVSGGSVGTGIFWAIYNSGLCQRQAKEGAKDFGDCHKKAVRQILGEDYLSPMFATFYTRDLVDTVVPVSALATVLGLGPIDRGAVFEAHLVTAYQNWFDDRSRDLKLCKTTRECRDLPGRDLLSMTVTDAGRMFSASPMPIFNAVDVDQGDLIVMSPFSKLHDDRRGYTTLSGDEDAKSDLTMVQAMVASARFPIITPPLRLPYHNNSVQQIADGGYFDNSGIESIWDVIDNLIANEIGSLEIHVVLLTLEDEEDDKRPALHGTLGSPVSAFMASWRSRQSLLKSRFENFAGRDDVQVEVCEARVDLTDDIAGNFTLSWFLAKASLENIEKKLLQLEGNAFCSEYL